MPYHSSDTKRPRRPFWIEHLPRPQNFHTSAVQISFYDQKLWTAKPILPKYRPPHRSALPGHGQNVSVHVSEKIVLSTSLLLYLVSGLHITPKPMNLQPKPSFHITTRVTRPDVCNRILSTSNSPSNSSWTASTSNTTECPDTKPRT